MAKARPSIRARQEQAAKARTRMAKRAKRARFFKEQKKNILLICVGLLLIGFLVFFTPFGPDWYYSKIQARKFANQSTVNPGVLRDLYKLGNFYNHTLRKEQAMKTYDEVGMLYYGFTFSEFSRNPSGSMDTRFEKERQIAKGNAYGPPYKIDPSDLRYVGLSLAEASWIVNDSGTSKQFAMRLMNELYMEDFYEEHPEVCDPKVTELIKNTGDRLAKRR